MSSLGASFAGVYVQQKRQEEKLKKTEAAPEKNPGKAAVKNCSFKGGKTKKVCPTASPPSTLNNVGSLGKNSGYEG